MPRDDRIVYLRRDQRSSVGVKRNLACEHAEGELIAHFDDDDWYAPNRLSIQVAALRESGHASAGCAICCISICATAAATSTCT